MISQSRMEDRRLRAAKIIANPSAHKICEGCESIVIQTAIICPSCSAYRFNYSKEQVVEHASYLANRPALSVTAQDYQ